MEVMQIDDTHIAFRHRQGLTRTIMFANSLGSDQSIWDAVIAALPTGYGILTYDLRGHGYSSGAANRIETLANDAERLIDGLALEEVIFCGISIGGLIGQILASKRADVIRAAVLCNTAPQIGVKEKWSHRINAIETQGMAAMAPEISRAWFGPDYSKNSAHLALHQAMLTRTDKRGYGAACAAIRDADLTAIAHTISVPTLCLAGRHDNLVPIAQVEGLAKLIPKAHFQIIEGSGHMPSLEAPQALADAIVTFDPPQQDETTAGMAMRRKLLGANHLARVEAESTKLDTAFQSLITTGAWGSVWANPDISARERSMLTLALLAATGNFEEIPMHIRACARTGTTLRDIAQVFQHVAIYAGVPKANYALKLAKQTLAEQAQDG